MFRPLQDTQISLGALQDEMNQVFDRVWHGGLSTRPFDGQKWAPAIDVYERDDLYIVQVEMSGVDSKDVEVTHVGTSLTIRGERPNPFESQEDVQRLRGERRFGGFCRTIDLPEDIDAEKLSAKCHCGLLEISIPKTASSRPKAVKIEVQGE